MKHFSLRRLSLITILAVSTTVLLSGCVPKEFQPLPTKERYQYINAVKDALDLETAGTIIKQGYDKNGGVIEPSYYFAILENAEPYVLIKTRLEAIPNITDCSSNERQITCRLDNAEVILQNATPGSPNTKLHINDSFSGRDPK